MKNSFYILIFFLIPLNILSQDISQEDSYAISKITSPISESLFEIGSENIGNENFSLIFQNKNYDDIVHFLENLPVKNSNQFIQSLIYKILKTNFSIDGLNLTKEEDNNLFQLRVSKLFDTARFTDIDIIHSKTPRDFESESLNLKKVEGFFLRNEFKNGCELITNKEFTESLAKFRIICSIIELDFDKARFNISLLKEKKQPGDDLFIELCYSIIGDVQISKSKLFSEHLEKISSLNPILLSSLQIAEVSPKFEHVKNASTSVLTFILSSPSSSTDIKLYTAENLVRQNRIKNDMLAEIYQLTSFKDEEIKNAIKNYKTLSPVRARSLLYQAIIEEKDEELKFELVKTLLKHSQQDKLFENISHLIIDSLDFLKIKNLSYDENRIIMDMFLVVGDFISANNFLNKVAIADDRETNYIASIVLYDLFQYIENKYPFSLDKLEELIDKNISDNKYDSKSEKIIIISSLLFEFQQSLSSKLFKANSLFSKPNSNFNSITFSLGTKYINENDLFNSLKILFDIFEKKSVEDLNGSELFIVAHILKKFGFENEFSTFSKQLFLGKI